MEQQQQTFRCFLFFFFSSRWERACRTLPRQHSWNIETARFLPRAPPLLISLTFFPPSHFAAADRNQIVARVFLILAVCHQRRRRRRRVSGCLDTEGGAAIGAINSRTIDMFTRASPHVHDKPPPPKPPRPVCKYITPAADWLKPLHCDGETSL